MLYISLGALCIGFAPILVKAIVDLGPTAIGFYRCLFASVFLLIPFLLGGKKWRVHVARKIFSLQILAGAILAFDFCIWNRSVVYVGAGISTILANTQVFYTALLGAVFLKQAIKKPLWLVIGITFFGIYLLVEPTFADQSIVNAPLGVFLGLLTGPVYATFILVLNRANQMQARGIPLQSWLVVSASAAFFLGIQSAVENNLHIPIDNDLIWLLLLALVAQVIGWLLINSRIAHVPISKSGLLLLIQPVAATIMGAYFFHEHLSISQIIGAGITLMSIYFGSRLK